MTITKVSKSIIIFCSLIHLNFSVRVKQFKQVQTPPQVDRAIITSSQPDYTHIVHDDPI